MPGRHASPARPRFYRDLLTMIGGILVVAIMVYLGLTGFLRHAEPRVDQYHGSSHDHDGSSDDHHGRATTSTRTNNYDHRGTDHDQHRRRHDRELCGRRTRFGSGC